MKRKLKIAQIAPISERIPPKKYGGTERVIHALTEELVRRGHDVTLFGSGDSQTSAKLVSVYPRSLREAKIRDPYGLNSWTLLNIAFAYERQTEFDIIHDHNHLFSLPTAQLAKTPVVITIHGPVLPDNRRLYKTITAPRYVAISKAQTRRVPDLKVAATIYHGLPMEKYPFGSSPKGYLLVVGRISMEKGVHYAIDVANYLNIPLIIAGKLDKAEERYFHEYVEPRLSDEGITWVGEVDETKRNELMSSALCLLHPVTYREPFGLNLIESLACGCPVVAFNKGSIPEIIQNGKTGYVVEDTEEMIDAIGNIGRIDRAQCRRYALEHFSDKTMTDNYEELYYQILS